MPITSFSLNQSITTLNLSCRLRNALEKANIHTLNDLTKLTQFDFLFIKGVGNKSYNEILYKLKERGIILLYHKSCREKSNNIMKETCDKCYTSDKCSYRK